jgi:hypothetical protein
MVDRLVSHYQVEWVSLVPVREANTDGGNDRFEVFIDKNVVGLQCGQNGDKDSLDSSVDGNDDGDDTLLSSSSSPF